jgi:oligopeptide transport system ATP-binding protein
MEPLLRVTDLKAYYRTEAYGVSRTVQAVDGVSFDLRAGETLGVVGESGCGKSTLGRLLMRLEEPTAGVLHFDGVDMYSQDRRSMRRLRRDIQIVFQDPYASLNPRMPVRDTIAEPLIVHGTSKSEARARVGDLLEAVGNPVAVNPDAALEKVARSEGWRIMRFDRLGPIIKIGSGLLAVALVGGGGGYAVARARKPKRRRPSLT